MPSDKIHINKYKYTCLQCLFYVNKSYKHTVKKAYRDILTQLASLICLNSLICYVTLSRTTATTYAFHAMISAYSSLFVKSKGIEEKIL